MAGVPMVNPLTNAVEQIHPDDVELARDQGYSEQTPQDIAERDYIENDANTFGEAATAAGEGLASGLTFGAYDALASELGGEEYRARRQLREQAHPGLSMLGQAGAFLVPGLGEAALAGRVGKSVAGAVRIAGAPVAALTRGSRAVGETVARGLSRGTPGFGRELLARGAGAGVSGMIEGAGIGVQQAVSEAALGDSELTGELLLAHMRDGATIGGGLSSGLSVLGRVGKAALRGTSKATEGFSIGGAIGDRGLAGVADSQALNAAGFLGSDVARVVQEMGEDAPFRLGNRISEALKFTGPKAISRGVRHSLGGVSRVAKSRLDDTVEQLDSLYSNADAAGAGFDVVRSVRNINENIVGPLRKSGMRPYVSMANRIERTVDKLYRTFEDAERAAVTRDNVVKFWENIAVADDAISRLSRAKKLGANVGELNFLKESVAAARATARRSADAIKEELEKLGAKGATTLVERATTLVEKGKGASRRVGLRSTFDKLVPEMRTLTEQANPTITLSEARQIRTRVDKLKRKWGRDQHPMEAELSKLRTIIAGQIDEQMQKVGLGEKFKAANLAYGDWKIIEKVASKRAGSLIGNRTIGLTDTGTAIGGGILGTLTGGPIGGILVGGAAAIGNKFIRSPAGSRLFSAGASTIAESPRLARMQALIEATDRTVARIDGSTKKALPSKRWAPKLVGFSDALANDFESKRDTTLAKQESREQIASAVASNSGEIVKVAPLTVSAMARAAVRGQNMVNALMPKSNGFNDVVSRANPELLSPSEDEELDWLRISTAIEDPLELLDRLEENRVLPDEVAAVAETSPALYATLQRNILMHLVEGIQEGEVPSHQSLLSASIATGLPLDATMRPEVISLYQDMWTQQAPQMPQPDRASTARSRYANRRMTKTEEHGDEYV